MPEIDLTGPKPFEISIAPSEIEDLKSRLGATRWSGIAECQWSLGTDPSYLRNLCRHWQTGFDWPAQERMLNALPHFTVSVDGRTLHYVHVRGRGESPFPIILTHGWPSSFLEYLKIIPLLTDPAAHGGRSEDAFDVVIPSLPGFGFSEAPDGAGISTTKVAELWATLMGDVLGYPRFMAHGGDIGGSVTNRLGRHHADRVVAIHCISSPRPRRSEAPHSEAETAYLSKLSRWRKAEGAYAHLQGTKPNSLLPGLNDSPVGLAAWMVEKWQAWSDCGGDIASRFSMDELLTQISLYWFTQTIGSAARYYLPSGDRNTDQPIDLPVRLFLTSEPVNQCPPEWARRAYSNLSYGVAVRGGHFFAAEEPALLAGDLRSFAARFRS